jgi:hypothetical protein
MITISALCEFSPKLNKSLNGQIISVKRLSGDSAKDKFVGIDKINGEILKTLQDRQMAIVYKMVLAPDVH